MMYAMDWTGGRNGFMHAIDEDSVKRPPFFSVSLFFLYSNLFWQDTLPSTKAGVYVRIYG